VQYSIHRRTKAQRIAVEFERIIKKRNENVHVKTDSNMESQNKAGGVKT